LTALNLWWLGTCF